MRNIISNGIGSRWMNQGGGIPMQSEASAFISAWSIVDNAEIKAINETVYYFKKFGLVIFADLSNSKIKAFYPYRKNLTTSVANLINPANTDAAFRLTLSGTFTWSKGGLIPDTTTAYANTHLKPSTSLAQNSSHLMMYSKTATKDTGFDMGGTNGSGRYRLIPGYGTSGTTAYGDLSKTEAGAIVNYNDADGLYILNRNNSANYQLDRNGKLIWTGASTSEAPTNADLFLFGFNNSGSSIKGKKAVLCHGLGLGLTDQDKINYNWTVQNFAKILDEQQGLVNKYGALYYGDSVVLGTGASDDAHSWVNIYSAQNNFIETNRAVGGNPMQAPDGTYINSVRLLINNLETYNGANKFVHVCSVINDIYYPTYTVERYATQFPEVIDIILSKGYPSQNIIVGTCTPITNFGTGNIDKLLAINQIVRDTATSKNTQMVDFWNSGISYTGVDGIHPNDTMHSLLASFAASNVNTSV